MKHSSSLLSIFFESKTALLGSILFSLFVAMAILAPLIVPQDPYDLSQIYLHNSFRPPGSSFWLGTDEMGRDIYSAILYGLRTSLYVGVVSTLLSMVIGLVIGLISGYYGGWVDRLMMRLADIQLSFPAILIALIVMALWGQGINKIIVAITIVSWVYYARTVRGVVLQEKEREYVQSARALGMRSGGILFGEILPNVLSPVIVLATVRIAYAIVLEATLSFLGVGVPITEPSLGTLISNGYQALFSGYWWTSVYPGVVLVLLIISINLLGDRLREVMNPTGGV